MKSLVASKRTRRWKMDESVMAKAEKFFNLAK